MWVCGPVRGWRARLCVWRTSAAPARSESPASQRQARSALHRPPSPSPLALPSMDRPPRRRPNRTALARFEQYGRAHGRAVQLLLH
eukprot:5746864-Alexandrium_andersonii.AAC.1